MEQLVAEIEAFATRTGITPQKLLRDVINAPWGQWRKWRDGSASPTMQTADRIRAWMRANPPAATAQEDAA